MFSDAASRSLACLGLAHPGAAFAARTFADRLVLGALILLLFGAWHAMRALADRAARITFLAASFAFVGALSARAVVLPCAFVAVALVIRATLARRSATNLALATLGFAALAAAGLLPAPPPTLDAEADPATETRAALERGNLFEARLWGERWVAEHPDDPAAPALLLARIDWDLGHHDRARSIARDVAARSTDEDARRRASEQLQRWKDPP